MKIAIVGYGKMGKAIEQIAVDRGHTIGCIIDAGEEAKFSGEEFRSCDVAIEFSAPSAAVENYRRIFAAGVPVVSGTTGWTAAIDEVRLLAKSTGGRLLWASNFSIGVNMFMRINALAAKLLNVFPQYRPSMEEIHHIHKLDHPSGTAITIAETITANSRFEGWEEPQDGTPVADNLVPIAHRREGEVPGTHIVNWTSPVDRITLAHEAFSRQGFALGAVVAAEWLTAHPEEKGVVSIDTMFDSLLK